MISWVVYIAIGLVIGGAVGFFLGRLDDFSQKEKRAMQDKLDQAHKELAEYKHDVTDHFIATAGLVNNLTESYQAVHEHLVKGARTLCDHQVAVNRLEVTKSSAGIDKPDMATGSVPHQAETAASPDTAQSMGESEAIQTETIVKMQGGESEQKLDVRSDDANDNAGKSALKAEQKAETGQPQDVSKEKVSAKEGARKLNSDDNAVVSDQNDLTMASRMVH